MRPRIEAVLLDADGVLQRPGRAWQTLLDAAELRGEGFLEAVFAAEAPCLTSDADFAGELALVLARWDHPLSLENALAAWTDIVVDEGVLDCVARLRSEGIVCCVASNQQSYRARAMSSVLGYRERFEHEFYSCDLGAKKPEAGFFNGVLAALAIAPDRVLFLDDHERNVLGARSVGLLAEPFEPDGGPVELGRILREFGLPG